MVVIGATNRIDAIDPALRRPGRFDRELAFALPKRQARVDILTLLTKEWQPKAPQPAFLEALADRTSGYCGADLKALCAEGALVALKRRYPQIYSSSLKLQIDCGQIQILTRDFERAMEHIVPASRRSALTSTAVPLPSALHYILEPQLSSMLSRFQECGFSTDVENSSNNREEVDSEAEEREEYHHVYGQVLNQDECHICAGDGQLLCCDDCPQVYHRECLPEHSRPESVSVMELNTIETNTLDTQTSPDEERNRETKWSCPDCSQGKAEEQNLQTKDTFHRMAQLISAHRQVRVLIESPEAGLGHQALARALMHAFEHLQVFSLDLTELITDIHSSSLEQALVRRFTEAKKSVPCILYLPDLNVWWTQASALLRSTLVSSLAHFPSDVRSLVFMTVVNDGRSSGYIEEEEGFPGDETNSIPVALQRYFTSSCNPHVDIIHHHCEVPNDNHRKVLFGLILEHLKIRPPAAVTTGSRSGRVKRREEQLLIVDFPQVSRVEKKKKKLTQEELQEQKERDFHYLRELRIFLGSVLAYFYQDKQYEIFWRAVDAEEVPDYYLIIANPMDLDLMSEKLNDGVYLCLEDFLADIQLLVQNASEYNPRHSVTRVIARVASSMVDIILSYAHRFRKQQGYNLFAKCSAIARRVRRGKDSGSVEMTDTPGTVQRGLAQGCTHESSSSSSSVHDKDPKSLGRRSSARLQGEAPDMAPLGTTTTTTTQNVETIENLPAHTELEATKPFEEKEEEKVFQVGDHVFVSSRTSPGINKPGGAGRITDMNEEGLVTVKYVLGGMEKRIECCYLSELTEESVSNSFIPDSETPVEEEKQEDGETHLMTCPSSHGFNPEEVQLEYFLTNLWRHFETRGWTYVVDPTLGFFPCGITAENGTPDVDYFTSVPQLVQFIKRDAQLSAECYGKRFNETQLTSCLDEREVVDVAEGLGSIPTTTVTNVVVVVDPRPRTNEPTTKRMLEAQTSTNTLSSKRPRVEEELEIEQTFQLDYNQIQDDIEALVSVTRGWNIDRLSALEKDLSVLIYAARFDFDRRPVQAKVGQVITRLSR